MRGAPGARAARVVHHRIIPADAGSTPWEGVGDGATGGSSPQMRGALVLNAQEFYTLRIIPADAGSTHVRWIFQSNLKDHPRRCGEHFLSNEVTLFEEGSSPQMRGARTKRPAYIHSGRIIPADAGSTIHHGLCEGDHQDHPRRCGEHP